MSRIAVVGGRISGLSAADMLRAKHEVVLFEQSTRLGGHVRTLIVPGSAGLIAVDTGFIVYNEVNYRLLTKFFAMLGVPTKASEMSFGAPYGKSELEFSAGSVAGLFAQRRNLASPRYLGMLIDIGRFFTVEGGSQCYVEKIAGRLGASVQRDATVVRVERRQGVGVARADGGSEAFDEVVFACHADVALRLLAEPTPQEREILGAFRFRDDEAALHCDERAMPKALVAWASSNYRASGANDAHGVSVTYWINKLQGIDGDALSDCEIVAGKIFDRHTFRHPEFSQAAIDAQGRMGEIQGHRGVWYCGAWQRYGFHEDGLWSAVRVAEAEGLRVPWL